MDDQAWTQTRRRLRAFVAGRLSPAEAVDDVVQDVLTKMVQNLDELTDDTHVQAWAYRIARNALTDEYRRRGRASAAHLRAASAPPVGAEITDPTAEQVLANDLVELGACLRPLAEALDEPYRQALLATSWDGLTQAEAAVRAGVSLPGMKSRVQRGRAQLREQLIGCCRPEPGTSGQQGRPVASGCTCAQRIP